MEQEDEYLQILSEAETYEVNKRELRIFSGDRILVFQEIIRVPVKLVSK